MSRTQQVFAFGTPVSFEGLPRPRRSGQLRGADLRWAIAFVLPYAAVFFVFVVYPFGYALWMAGRPALYAELIANRSYLTAVVNTLLFVGIGVNVKMFLALLLSGFFLRPRWCQSPACRLCFALGDRGSTSLRLVSLDATAGGIGQWCVVSNVWD